MRMTMRWFGPSDTVSLPHIRQVPGVIGVVSGLYDIPLGEGWPLEELRRLQAQIEASGLQLVVIVSIPGHEAIKLGAPEPDHYIDNYCQSLCKMRRLGMRVWQYNLMPIVERMRIDVT